MKLLLQMALRNLLAARRRSLLLGGALAAVTALLVLLMALSAGISKTLVENATTLTAGHINVGGFYKIKASSAAPLVVGTERVRKVVEDHTPALSLLVDRQRGWGKVVSPTSSLQAALIGVDIEEERRLIGVLQRARASEYREAGGDEVEGRLAGIGEPNQALLFASQAKRLGVGVGDAVTLVMETMGGRKNSIDVTVAAIARDLGMASRWNVFLSKKTVQELYQLKPDTTGAIMVYLDDIDEASNTMGILREAFAAEGFDVMEHRPSPFWRKFETVSGEDWTGQKLDLTIWEDEVSFMTWITKGFNLVTFFLISVLLVIIVVGMMNTMWMAVSERVQEVGTLRAIGMGRLKVLLLFLTEALLLSAFATGAGALLGAGLATVLQAAQIAVPMAILESLFMGTVVRLFVDPGSVFLAALGLTLTVSLAALPPAIRAASLTPMAAISKAR